MLDCAFKNKKTDLKNKHETQTNTLAFKTYYLAPHAAHKRKTLNMLTLRPRIRQTADARSQRFRNKNHKKQSEQSHVRCVVM